MFKRYLILIMEVIRKELLIISLLLDVLLIIMQYQLEMLESFLQ